MEFFTEIITNIDDAIYTYIVVGLLLIAGIYFSFRTKFIQLRRLPDMFKYLVDKKHDEGKKALSSFQALMISTGSRVGTGNIAGIATAIILGGPGSVFWMWVLAIIGASSAFVESTLAQIWKKKNKDGSFRGGPAYYIEQGIGKHWLGVLFAVSLILVFACGFNALQSYNAASSLDYYFEQLNIDMNLIHIIVGVILMALAAFAFFGGMKIIGHISSAVVPIMALIYVGIALITILANFLNMGLVFSIIFENAFSLQSILSGAAGTALMYGTKRGLLSNEAGMGSVPNAAACASVSHPAKQGLIQSLSAYIDTFFICTSSAFIVLLYIVEFPENVGDLNGIPLVQMSLTNTFGEFGIHFMTISIFFFAFSSIIGNYCYAENNFKFIFGEKRFLNIFRVLCIFPVFIGSMLSIDLAWGFADIFMALMASINIISIIYLGKWSVAVLKDYDKQKKQGLDPVFKASDIDGLPKTDCW